MPSVAVILAAGRGSRFEGPTHKLLTPLRGRSLVVWGIEAARAAHLDHTLVVTGAVDLDEVLPVGVEHVHNPAWADGIATSLHAAIDHVRAAWGEIDSVVVGLGDQPGVPAEAWRAVADATATPIAVATYDGARRNPVRLDREIWHHLPASGDVGAQRVMRDHPEWVTDVPCPGSGLDVDTTADLHRLA